MGQNTCTLSTKVLPNIPGNSGHCFLPSLPAPTDNIADYFPRRWCLENNQPHIAQTNKVFCPKCSRVSKNTYLGITMAWIIFYRRIFFRSQELGTLSILSFSEYGVWKITSPIQRRQTKCSAQNVPLCLKTQISALPWPGSFSTGEYSFSTKNSGLWVFCFLSITHRENHSFVNSCLSICCDMLRYLALSLHYLALFMKTVK